MVPAKLILWALIASIILIWLGVEFIDRPVVDFVRARNFVDITPLHWMGKVASFIELFVFIYFVYIAQVLWRRKLSTGEMKALMVALSVAVVKTCKIFLKFVFARYWPETWVCGNPSWVRDGETGYGFQFFSSGSWYQSFPSGHTAVTFAAAVVFAKLFPRYAIAAYLAMLAVVLGQIGRAYHFVSDVVAGAVLGYIVATYVVTLYRQYQEQ